MITEETDLDRLKHVQASIRRAARDSGRQPDDVRLVCVSKTIDAARIQQVLAAGMRDFGENRVQEANDKWPALRATYPGLCLRLIGPLQTNKARDAIKLFDIIETLDRPKLAVELAAQAQKLGMCPRLYIQVNIGAEPQKAGVSISDADEFIRHCRDELDLPIDGLMCIPPADQLAAPYFARMQQIAARNGIRKLSMGMSGDFETAIQLGATEVRIGSAIFGAR